MEKLKPVVAGRDNIQDKTRLRGLQSISNDI